MPGLTTYFVNNIMDHCLRGQPWTPPASLHMQAHKGDPTEFGTANLLSVTTRQLVQLKAPSLGECLLVLDLHWLTSVKEAASHLSLWDQVTAGNCLATFELEEVVNLYIGDIIEVPTLSIQIPARA